MIEKKKPNSSVNQICFFDSTILHYDKENKKVKYIIIIYREKKYSVYWKRHVSFPNPSAKTWNKVC